MHQEKEPPKPQSRNSSLPSSCLFLLLFFSLPSFSLAQGPPPLQLSLMTGDKGTLLHPVAPSSESLKTQQEELLPFLPY